MVELLMESPTLLFGPVVGLLVVLLLLLWLMGRRRKSSGELADTAAAVNSSEEPILSSSNGDDGGDEALGSFTIIRRDDETTEPAIDIQGVDSDEDNQSPTSEPALHLSDAAIAYADRLAAIEQEMLAVRDLYQQEKIKTDVYVSETRALFEEAKKLTSG